jgi:hypothetical protein
MTLGLASWLGRRLGRRAMGVVALIVAVMAAGCGSSNSSSGGGGGISGITHDSPDGAVRGLVAALVNWDGSQSGLNAVTDWVNPAQRSDFTSGFSLLGGSNVKFSFKITSFDVASVDNTDSTHAVVHVKGSASFCISGVISSVTLNTCSSSSLTPSGTKDTVNAVKVNGQWYVDSGSGTSSSSSSSDTGIPTSTDTGSSSPST